MRKGGEWEDTVIDTAQWLGWKVMHIRPVFDSRRKRWVTGIAADGAGWPDLTLVRDRVIYAELKASGKLLAGDQAAWRDRLQNAGQEYYVWRDTDDFNEIVAVLRRRGPWAPMPA